jgi:ubiquinone/menaquinone biosynthesis C-methylase UbiE
MILPQSAEQAFNRDAAIYDAGRRALIPCFDGFYGNALEVVADWGGPPAPRVLDLGAGTGLFAAMVLTALPQASITLTDISDEMLTQARNRFGGDGSVHYERMDLAADEIHGMWDLIISALAIHHLSDEEKRGVFSRVYRQLAPGGLFINAEQVLGPTPAQEQQYRTLWERQIRANGVDNAGVQRANERMAFDRCSTVADQLQWMSQAGFGRVDCTFKAWRFAVMAGWKA